MFRIGNWPNIARQKKNITSTKHSQQEEIQKQQHILFI